jgi:hypothetical protein
MRTLKQVRATLVSAEKEFRTCCETVLLMKHYSQKEPIGSLILDFQPRLCSTLWKLERLYQKLCSEKDKIVRWSNSESQQRVLRLRAIGRAQRIVESAIGVGKTLGDAFAWFFYRNDLELLQEHLKQPRQIHLPPGIGGIGELEFVRNVKHISGCMVLYHGTTSILRIGDFSLIDLTQLKVKSLGELKSTETAPSTVRIQLFMTGPDLLQRRSSDALKPSKPIEPPLPSRLRDRLVRQIRRMAMAFERPTPEPADEISQTLDGHYGDVNRLVAKARCGEFTCAQAGPSMLVVLYKGFAHTLFSRLDPDANEGWQGNLDSLPQEAVSIVKPGSTRNAVHIGSVLYAGDPVAPLLLGAQPLLWSPLHDEVLRQILFQEVVIFTLYNPAFLLDKLSEHGWEIIGEKPSELALRKTDKAGRYLRFEQLQYFLRLRTEYLFTDNDIEALIRESLEVAEHANVEVGTKITFQFQQMFGPKASA